ncbi:signal peptidase II [Paludicola sp. MB14-C6]|uniref:signal peptidase II n=1 Tax=Paludihabitans sp. MB14-C6 TaxID=3070656 RepID=UPI0027DE606F|nr:signal peptidase II [Paludicola sp. MB14-C6]WMJ23840.1 signal peptidase II [Paludicola sp. MB14-C6]
MKNKTTWACILGLIAIEQSIKIVINQFFFHEYRPILPPYLYFSPLFNRDYSWFNSMLQLGVGKWAHIITTTIIILFIITAYIFISNTYQKDNLLNSCFAFLLSGSLCSFIDKVFWNGSLDYIQVTGFFTFDLKDVYLNVAIGLAIILMIVKRKTINDMDDALFLKNYWNYTTKWFRKQENIK